MNAHEAFVERTKRIEALTYRLDRLVCRRDNLIKEFEKVREIVEKRHYEGLSAASLLCDLFTYREQLWTDAHELDSLFQNIEQQIAGDQSGG